MDANYFFTLFELLNLFHRRSEARDREFDRSSQELLAAKQLYCNAVEYVLAKDTFFLRRKRR